MSHTTRFQIYLQPPYVPEFELPATVEIETEAAVAAGPRDELLYALDAENKPGYSAQAPHEYQPYRGRPWRGDVNRKVAQPGEDGHFDRLAADDPAFPAASVYATARLVLNYWNRIFDAAGLERVTKWHHQAEALIREEEAASVAAHLQLVPRCVSAGSRSGYGYIELGRDNPGHRYGPRDDAQTLSMYQKGPMWQNFDVIAHEIGHAILFTRIGFPGRAAGITEWFKIPDAEFLAFHESMADLSAILSLLSVKEARRYVLNRKDGIDLLAGIGELQNLSEPGFLPIRTALNCQRYPGPHKFANQDAHINSMSLTAAVFEALIAVYQHLNGPSHSKGTADEALLAAGEVVAKSLAKLWANPDYLWNKPDTREGLSFTKVGNALVALITAELEARDPKGFAAVGKPTSAASEITAGFRNHGL